MNALGFALLVMGAVLMVAEAHLPGGVLGVAGAIALIAGGVIVIAALGGGAMLAVPVGVGLGGAAGAWAVLAARKAASAPSGSSSARKWPALTFASAISGAKVRRHTCGGVSVARPRAR